MAVSLVFMLVYVWSREFPNALVSFYGLVSLKVCFNIIKVILVFMLRLLELDEAYVCLIYELILKLFFRPSIFRG